ncbi:NADPH:quinone reductase [Sulfitobacter mediterraneus]|uniref:NADPH:quinone reductase n=1 Tax=Sulfitobacter mediterraneus TaxID=83219 RepID=UPI001939BDBE|nr:NADPH:quinone reductase [Sulfitobacter mediterraneus]MBM1558106.1 NADPH:quinone reductase [Sulfitobacter mediterraneus]MBM1569466.1 NADPH:quinone reductase [Sulfitobacter mediterraneus]MBM1573311.1 NADPH:quinone reductase [Sulfitobacter mediterraneus]MBM1577073.1 NADPH:quinone reductase [Sulfitobacter mediterraneus]MBM1581096.1 NADPH:quinone reductase [Sulfitobacter mediterraneus]
MHAITYDSFGSAADVLKSADLPCPDPAAGEVAVKLVYSGVNPSDVKSRAGGRPGVTKPAFDQIIPHSDGAGEVVAVGAGVDAARVGQRVWIWNGQWQRPFGTAASHITLPSQQAVPLPDAVSFETGASLGIPGLTACHAVFGGGDVAGDTVLIQGGAGTVGLLAVQLAKWGGAKVIATCSPKDMEAVRAAGADHVIDYRADDLPAQVLAANDGAFVETIVEVEFGINIAMDTEVIAPNGRIAAYGAAKELSPTLPFYPLLFKAVTIDIILIYLLPPAEREQTITRLHNALTDGALDCPVEKIYPLGETVQAHQAVEAAVRSGAILIDCQS